MTIQGKKIAFKLELSRMLELLADEIYQSPLSLLRENTQNALGNRNDGAFVVVEKPLSANLTETPAPLGITVGRWR